jgi:hypothetical protein
LREFRVAVPEQNIRSYTAMLRQRNCASFFFNFLAPLPPNLDCAFLQRILRINSPTNSTSNIRF